MKPLVREPKEARRQRASSSKDDAAEATVTAATVKWTPDLAETPSESLDSAGLGRTKHLTGSLSENANGYFRGRRRQSIRILLSDDSRVVVDVDSVLNEC